MLRWTFSSFVGCCWNRWIEFSFSLLGVTVVVASDENNKARLRGWWYNQYYKRTFYFRPRAPGLMMTSNTWAVGREV